MMQKSEAPFIHFSKPGKVNPENRKKIATYIGRNYRNRSRPSLRSDGGITIDPYKGPQSELKDGSTLKAVNPSQADKEKDKDLNVESEGHARSLVIPAHSKHKKGAKHAKVFVDHDGHGFWFDPFESLPIIPQGNVTQMISYSILNIYAPTHLIRPGYILPLEGHAEVRSYFRSALQHPALFAALLSVSQCHISAHNNHGMIGDGLVLHYYGVGISNLQEDLLGESANLDDMVIATIITLMNVDLNLGRIRSFRVHMHGLCQVIQRRGGVENIKFASIQRPILEAFHAYDAYFERFLAEDTQIPLTTAKVTNLESFSSNILQEKEFDHCALDATPEIIIELARQDLLSAPVVGLATQMSMEAVSEPSGTQEPQARPQVPKPNQRDASNLQAIEHISMVLGKTAFPSTDHIACLAFFYEKVHATPIGRFNNIIHRLSAFHAQKLVALEGHHLCRPEEDLLIIALALLVRTLTASGSKVARIHADLIASMIDRVNTLKKARDLLKILRKFYMSEPPCQNLWEAFRSADDTWHWWSA